MFRIKTSVYINKSLLKLLDDSACKVNVKKSVLVSRLFIAVKNKRQLHMQQNITVKYQKKDDNKSNWKIHRINFEPEVYEICIDMRNVYKFSVSWILAFAIRNYLDDILNDILGKKNEDNYTPVYTFIPHDSSHIFGFTVYWGKPPT